MVKDFSYLNNKQSKKNRANTQESVLTYYKQATLLLPYVVLLLSQIAADTSPVAYNIYF